MVRSPDFNQSGLFPALRLATKIRYEADFSCYIFFLQVKRTPGEKKRLGKNV